MNDLIKGAYDMHVHSAPDVLPRKFDDFEMAARVTEFGLGGYIIKSHYFNTAARAALVNKLYPKCDAVGALTLNRATGGINPMAVEMAARDGSRLIWFPTTDSANEVAHVFGGDPGKKKPYWARVVLELKEQGVVVPPISILNNGRLTDETLDVLKTIAKHDLILATGHLSHEEVFALLPEAKLQGVQRIVVTHVDFPTTFYTIEEQKALLAYGAYMEHNYVTWNSGKVDFAVTVEQIRAIGADRVIIATDLGQSAGCYPDEGLSEFAEKLLANGFSEDEIRTMFVKNTRQLVRG